MGLARTVSSIVLALRNGVGIGVRQPLGTISVVAGADASPEDLEAVRETILSEVNVKALELIPAGSGVVEKSAKPNFKVLGRKLGKKMKAANAVIRSLTTEQIDTYEQTGELTLDLDGEETTFGPGDLDIVSEGIEGREVGQENGVVVALDTTLTDALKAEGYARELVNRVQNLRKSAGFDVADRITLAVAAPPALAEAFAEHAETIQGETLAQTLHLGDEAEGETGAEATETTEIDGQAVTLAVTRTEQTAKPSV